MAARVNKVKHDPQTIERIRATVQTGQLINRLTEFVNGKIELAPAQVTAALGLLKKTLPDLTAVEHSGEVETTYVTRVPNASKNMDEWQSEHANKLNQTIQ
jgi:hypothetical protein